MSYDPHRSRLPMGLPRQPAVLADRHCSMPQVVRRLLRDCRGVYAYEYALITAAIVIPCAGAFELIRGAFSGAFVSAVATMLSPH